jgi:hypothetical protein
MGKKKQYYLLTYELVPGRFRMHAYLMVATTDRAALNVGIERLANEGDKLAEKMGFRVVAPIILSTHLTTGVKIVQDIVCKNFPQTKKNMLSAKEVHFTVWAWGTKDNLDDAKLMELH